MEQHDERGNKYFHRLQLVSKKKFGLGEKPVQLNIW
jgi:hypothetical protein